MNSDIVFISYDEENADENYEHLIKYFPNAKRVHGVEGIREAHVAAAKLANSNFFFTVDGDNKIIPNSDLSLPEDINENTVYVWRCKNAVNNLVYGFGAIKLWPKKIFSDDLTHYTDHAMTATRNYKVINKLASTTHFNTSPFSAWRSGFREAVKLAKNIQENADQFSLQRLSIWKSEGSSKPFGEWTIKGAKMGEAFFKNSQDIQLINDFEKLKDIFLETKLD